MDLDSIVKCKNDDFDDRKGQLSPHNAFSVCTDSRFVAERKWEKFEYSRNLLVGPEETRYLWWNPRAIILCEASVELLYFEYSKFYTRDETVHKKLFNATAIKCLAMKLATIYSPT